MRACLLCGGSVREVLLECEDKLVTHERFRIVVCPGCGLRSTDPAPDDASLWRYYESESYVPLGGPASLPYRAGRQIMHRLKRYWIQREGHQAGRLLDVGCGTGAFLRYMGRRGWQAAGVEPHNGARLLASESGAVVAASMQTLDDNRPFDVVTLWNVIEHVRDPVALLRDARDRMDTAGLLVVACPNAEAFDAERFGPDWHAWDTPRHLWHFTPATMDRLLSKAGYRLERLRSMPLDPFYIALSSAGAARALAVGTQAWWTGLRAPHRASALAYLARPSTQALRKGGRSRAAAKS